MWNVLWWVKYIFLFWRFASITVFLYLMFLFCLHLGFVVSCAVDNERNATYMALGSFLPVVMLCGKYNECSYWINSEKSEQVLLFTSYWTPFSLFLTGIIWPVEGMHNILKVISVFLPLTKSTESMRAMLARGWSITSPAVYLGFISTLLWIAVFLTLSILLIKFKKG